MNKSQKEAPYKRKDRVVTIKKPDKNRAAKLAENIRKRVKR